MKRNERMLLLAFGLTWAGASALALALTAVDADAERIPSPELRFKVTIPADSITLGDPIPVRIEAEAPESGTLLLPQFADSVGPFTVLSAGLIERTSEHGRRTLTQQVVLTLFSTQGGMLPALPLLWVRADGDTAVAYSEPRAVGVRNLLEGDARDLSKLRDVKGVVGLGGPWAWIWIAGTFVLLGLGIWLWRRYGRKGVEAVLPPPLPPVAPELAFERDLAFLLEKGYVERGELKEYYVELSQLLRRYLEDRFAFPAVEATRSEVLAVVAQRPVFSTEDRRFLAGWLEAGDLVKFARGERLLKEAFDDAEAARRWVRTISENARRPADRAASAPPIAEPLEGGVA